MANPPVIDMTDGTVDHPTAVFLLGAGCSAHCGAPLMCDFMKSVREYSEERKNPFASDYNRVTALWRECLRSAYVLDRGWDNIEELFTQAHLREIAGGDKTLCNAMRRVIWDVYRRPSLARAGYNVFANCLMTMVGQMNEAGGPRPVVITTNYDVYLECELIERYKIAYPGVAVESANSQFEYPERARKQSEGKATAIEICKLHGSVNWIGEGKETRLLYGTERHNGYPHFSCQMNAFAMGLFGRQDAFTPQIVPPMLGKTSDCEVIRSQWQHAIDAMRLAKTIWFIGYGFAETDTFMTRLISDAVIKNDFLESIVIANPCPDQAWRSRVEGMFTRTWWKMAVKRIPVGFEVLALTLDNIKSSAPEQAIHELVHGRRLSLDW